MQTLQESMTIQPAMCSISERRISPQQARWTLERALVQASAALEQRHPDWYRSLFDLSLFTHEAASLMDRWVRTGIMPEPFDLARCWLDSIGIRRPERRAARLRELEPIAAEFLRDLCRTL